MNFQRFEVQHNTPEQVAEYIEGAIEIADQQGRDGSAWSAIFRAAYDGLSSKSVQLEAQPVVPLDHLINGRGR